MAIGPLIGFCVGALVAGSLVWLGLRARFAAVLDAASRHESTVREAIHERDARARELGEAQRQLARLETALEHERRAAGEKLQLVEQAKSDLSNAFKALSSEALQANNSSFLSLAKTTLERYQVQARDELQQRERAVEQLVRPINESLQQVDGKIQLLEQARREAYGSITEQVRALAEGQERLRGETGNLVTALRAPATRGRWGEIQLRRVVEMAGMVAHCDFFEQSSVLADERRFRPDLVVKLPGGKNIVVDAKAPLVAYLEALEAKDDATREARLRDHARQIRQHITKLSAKSYWEQFQPTPEFVVLFLPGEAFYSAALEHDPGLIEEGVAQRVLLATPTTLIGVLKAVAYGWHQETVAENARAISELGRELYERLCVLGDHFVTLGRRLDGAVGAYNETVGSLERRVLPSARRFAELGVRGKKDIPTLDAVERVTQAPQAVELRGEREPFAGQLETVVELPGTDAAAAEPTRDAA